MPEENKQQTKSILKGQILNRKVLLGMFTLLSCVGVIIVSSFFPFIFDPTRWQTTEFLSDELIIIAISITSVVSTLFIGQSSNAGNPKSELSKARAGFFISVAKIVSISSFCQWVKRVLQPNDLKSIEKRLLRDVGVKDPSILALEINEIKSLEKAPQKFGDKYYGMLEKDQIKTILAIKKGQINVRFVEPHYYLTVSNINSDLTISEKSGNENKKKTFIMMFSIMWKLIFSVVFAMIFASFVRDITTEEIDKAECWMKLMARMFALISSATMGYRIGTQNNDIDADYINTRISVHNLYLQDTNFKPLSDEEIAREEYEKIQKEYQNARKSTLIPKEEIKDGTTSNNTNNTSEERIETTIQETNILD